MSAPPDGGARPRLASRSTHGSASSWARTPTGGSWATRRPPWPRPGSSTRSASCPPTGPRTTCSPTRATPPAAGCASSSPARAGRRTCPGCSPRRRRCPSSACPCRWRTSTGLDSLLSIVQMPAGVPVATVGVGAGRNAGLLAVRLLAVGDDALRDAVAAGPGRPGRRRPREGRGRCGTGWQGSGRADGVEIAGRPLSSRSTTDHAPHHQRRHPCRDQQQQLGRPVPRQGWWRSPQQPGRWRRDRQHDPSGAEPLRVRAPAPPPL